jgi:hypothetical protein
LQVLLGAVLDKYGSASTHWDKLIPKVNLGGGGECPLLLVGIEPGRIDHPDEMWKHYGYAVEAENIRTNWRQMGYESWTDAHREVDRLRARSQIGRLERGSDVEDR